MRSLMKHVLLLGNQGGAAWTPTFLLRDDFTTDASAPLTSPRTCEPGPGQLTFTQTNGNFSISSGNLVVPVASPTGYNVVEFYSDAITRAAGRTMFYKTSPLGEAVLGWMTSGAAASAGAAAPQLTSFVLRDHGYLNAPHPGNYIGTIEVAIVLRSAGAFFFAKGTPLTQWTLLWLNNTITTDPVYAAGNFYNTGATIDYVRVCDLPAPFNSDFGIAALNVASPVSATEYTGAADALIDMTVTAPGSLDGEVTTRCGFYYRADADLTPAWHCYVDGAGAFNLDSIASDGTRTNRIAVAGVIAGGATVTLRAYAGGTRHDTYTLAGTTWTKRGAQINVSLNDTATTIEPEIPAGWSAANLRCYPRTSVDYAIFDTVVNS